MAKAETKVAEEKAPAEAQAVEEKAPVLEKGKLVKVETTGQFMLYDVVTGAQIEAEGVSEVPYSPFIEQQIDIGQLKLVK